MPPRSETDNPPPTQAAETPWFSELKARRVTPNPTTKNLKEQCQYKVHKKKRKTAQTAPTHTHQQKAQALLARPLTHATKVETIKILTNMPSTTTSLHTQLERHLGHRVDDLPIHKDVGHALSQTPEERRILANTHKGFASKFAVPHAASRPRVHGISTSGAKVVSYCSTRPRAPTDVTMEGKSLTGLAPAKTLV